MFLYKKSLFVFFVASLLPACSPTLKEYESFADAGVKFNTALSSVADSAQSAGTRAAGENLIAYYSILERCISTSCPRGLGKCPEEAQKTCVVVETKTCTEKEISRPTENLDRGPVEACLRQKYKTQRDNVTLRADAMDGVRKTAAVMSRYFVKLGAYAKGAEAKDIAASLKDLGGELSDARDMLKQNLEKFPNLTFEKDKVESAAEKLGKFVVTEKITADLRAQLARDTDLLVDVMKLQKVVFLLVSEDVAAQQKLEKNNVESFERRSYVELDAGRSRSELAVWAKTWTDAVVTPVPASSISEAGNTLDSLMKAFQALLKDEFTWERLTDLYARASELEALADLMKS